ESNRNNVHGHRLPATTGHRSQYSMAYSSQPGKAAAGTREFGGRASTAPPPLGWDKNQCLHPSELASLRRWRPSMMVAVKNSLQHGRGQATTSLFIGRGSTGKFGKQDRGLCKSRCQLALPPGSARHWRNSTAYFMRLGGVQYTIYKQPWMAGGRETR